MLATPGGRVVNFPAIGLGELVSLRAALLMLCLCGSGSALGSPVSTFDPIDPAVENRIPAGRHGEREADPNHTVIIANQRTALPRLNDTLHTARKYHKRSVAALMAFRAQEDRNFARRARLLAHRMEGRFRSPPDFHAVTSGAEFLDALILASQDRPIKNLVIYGHAASTALYMREDIGFYADLGDVARQTVVVSGPDEDRRELLRLMGARDLADLERLVRNGHIRFEKDARIVFAGCEAAGRRDAEVLGIAGRIANMLDATVIASVGETDQSMARSAGARDKEFSRRSWVRFVRSEAPEKLNTRVIDVLNHLTTDEPKKAAPQPVPEPMQADSMPSERMRCALGYSADDPALCGGGVLPGAGALRGEMLAQLPDDDRAHE